jgi:hypothetical protein
VETPNKNAYMGIYVDISLRTLCEHTFMGGKAMGGLCKKIKKCKKRGW